MKHGERSARSAVGAVLVIVFLGAFLGFLVWAFSRLWVMAGPASISVDGRIAMILAGVLTLALGGGLMWLASQALRRTQGERTRPNRPGRRTSRS
jgi:hypothetical protein